MVKVLEKSIETHFKGSYLWWIIDSQKNMWNLF